MRFAAFVSAALLVVMGAIGLAQSVNYDFDKGTDFSKFKTYTWVRGTVLADELNHSRVVSAIDTQLVAKGLRQVAMSAKPDLLVAYHASFSRDLQISGFSSGFGPYRFGGNQTGMARTEKILNGTLAVDIVNAGTNTIVWRGIASKDVDVNAEPAKRDRNINRAAERLFKNYPPSR
jgi:hypothetical protein